MSDQQNEELFSPESVAMDSPRLIWMRKVKRDLAIFTHYNDEQGWLAFSHAKALECLSGHLLTEKEEQDPLTLFAGYCRLLDDARMVANGEPTECDAVEFVAKRHGVKFWNEETT